MEKVYKILANTIPVILMIGLIPLVRDDYLLAALDIVIIFVCLKISYSRKDRTVFWLGFVIMFVAESIFISTGVEKFERNSLFGLMPIWLPVLWGYGFVVIRRSLEILFHEKHHA